MAAIIQKFLSDHAALMGVVLLVNTILSCVVLVINKLVSGGIALPAVLVKIGGLLSKVVDFLSANVEHK